MDFVAVVDQVIALLRQRGRVTYRTLQLQFTLDDEQLAALKDELLYSQPHVIDDAGRGLVWTGDPGTTPAATAAPAQTPERAPLAYTPPYLAEKILTSKSALEGERKQVTVLFADLKGSMEILADRDPEEARQLLDPVLERMMTAVHRYEGTVNQVMGDGIMALFGAPIAHEDHAVRACYAAEVQRTHGVLIQIRVGVNAGEVVVRAIGNDLHMDYSAIGQTTHLAARMEQMAMPGSILITRAVLDFAEGYVQVTPLGPVPVKGLTEPVAVFALVGARSCTSPLRIIVSPRKPGKMSPYHPIVRGLFAMIPHQFYYQLVVLGLLWLCVMLHLAWPSPDVTTQTKPAKPITPRRQRSTEPKPFAGLTHKPHCALCAQEAAHPQAPPPVRPDPIPPTHRRPR